MNSFVIGTSEFGVNSQKSQISITSDPRGSGSALLTIDVKGNDAVFEELSSPEDSEWSWALYPPAFYMHEVPISMQIAKIGGELQFADRGELEIGLYMMEHSEIMDVTVKVLSGNEMDIRGTVDLFGEVLPFSISYVCAAHEA